MEVFANPAIFTSIAGLSRPSHVNERNARVTTTSERHKGFRAGSAAVALLGLASLGHLSSRSRRKPRRLCGTAHVTACRVVAAAAQTTPLLTVGTRGSPLAMAQAELTKKVLGERFPELAADGAVDIRVISTTGDERLDISLAEIGGKGLFTKELDVALMSKEVDFCVHSTKDLPTTLPPGSEIVSFLPREDTRDVLISPNKSIKRLQDLPNGSVVGTASLRRQAQIYAVNPTVTCVNFRGNVQTRLQKLKNGEVDVTLLAYAGLKRMDMAHHATSIFEWDEMLPAVGQGAIAWQCRADDERTKRWLAPLGHEPTAQAVHCERAFLAVLDGNCKTPIAGQAQVTDGQLHFRGLVMSPDGKRAFKVEKVGPADECEALGKAAGNQIRKEAGETFFEEMQEYVQAVAAANTKPANSST